jgi:hypothetical protein
MSKRGFTFIRMNEREQKPRQRGITEIRGPYYTPMVSATWRMCWKPWASTLIRSNLPVARLP